eukprot:scaffold13220_cov113-Isochrysis_galbana.AAC.5
MAHGALAAGPSRMAKPASSPVTRAPPKASSGNTLPSGGLRSDVALAKLSSARAVSGGSTLADTKSSARPLMQYRWPVGRGPSENT